MKITDKMSKYNTSQLPTEKEFEEFFISLLSSPSPGHPAIVGEVKAIALLLPVLGREIYELRRRVFELEKATRKPPYCE